MASQYFLNKTKGVQNLKKMMRGVVPFSLQQKAIRSYKECVGLLEQYTHLENRLEPIARAFFEKDGGVSDTAFDLMQEHNELIEQCGKVRDAIQASPWVFIQEKSRLGKKAKIKMLYAEPNKHKAYVIPNYNDL